MIRFTGFDFDDTARYSEYLGKCIQIPSDMSPLKIFAWRINTEEDDNMDILRGYEAELCWHKLLVGSNEFWTAPMGDWDAVDWKDVFRRNIPAGTQFRLVPEYLANLWKKKLGAAITMTEDRDSWDYILSMDRLKDPDGRQFTQFRRGKNTFEDNYDYEIVEFTPDTFDELREFHSEAEEDIAERIRNKDAAHFFENGLLFVIDSWDFYPEAFKSLYGFLIEVDGECAGYVINEQIDASHAIGLFYAVDDAYEGIGDFARWLDAKRNYERGILTVNVMDDIGEQHLRASKEALAPIVMLKKYTVLYNPAAGVEDDGVGSAGEAEDDANGLAGEAEDDGNGLDAGAEDDDEEIIRSETLRVAVRRSGGSLVISMLGRLDTTMADEVSRKINDRLDGETDVVFDLDGLSYISSAGIRVLVACYKEVKAAGGSIVLRNVSEGVREILDLTGISYIFELS